MFTIVKQPEIKPRYADKIGDFRVEYDSGRSTSVSVASSNATAILNPEYEEQLIAAIRDACTQVREMKEQGNG